MKRFVSCRHAYAPNGFDLNEKGQNQAEDLAKKIHALVNEGESFLVLSSIAIRARQTAKVISEDFEIMSGLETSDYSTEEIWALGHKILVEVGKDHDVVVVVTHCGAVEGIVNAVADLAWLPAPHLEEGETGNARGYVLDLETRMCKVV